MGKKSILSDAQDTLVAAAKTGAAIGKLAATAGLAAAGPAAAGVVLESVSKGLKSAEEKVAKTSPDKLSEGLGIMAPPAVNKTTRKKTAAKRKKRAVGNPASSKKRSAPKKQKIIRKRTVAKKAAKRKPGASQRTR
jgi:hypothetical protein